MARIKRFIVVVLGLMFLGSGINPAAADTGLLGRPGQMVTIYSTYQIPPASSQLLHRILPNGGVEIFDIPSGKYFVLTGMKAIFSPTYEEQPPFRLILRVNNTAVFAAELHRTPSSAPLPVGTPTVQQTGIWTFSGMINLDPGILLGEKLSVEVRQLAGYHNPDQGTLVGGWLSLSLIGYFWP